MTATALTEHPTLTALRQAVVADPDDDTLRLLFADELDEQGKPEYAEFVRVQVELAVVKRRLDHLESHSHTCWCHWCILRRREKELTALDRGVQRPDRLDSWSPDLWKMHSPTEHSVWRRGFVEELPTMVERWEKCGRDVIARWPIRRVILTNLVGMGKVVGKGRSWGSVTSYGMAPRARERLTGVTFSAWGDLKFDTADRSHSFLSQWDGSYERSRLRGHVPNLDETAGSEDDRLYEWESIRFRNGVRAP